VTPLIMIIPVWHKDLMSSRMSSKEIILLEYIQSWECFPEPF